jgi:hypothetical protein
LNGECFSEPFETSTGALGFAEPSFELAVVSGLIVRVREAFCNWPLGSSFYRCLDLFAAVVVIRGVCRLQGLPIVAIETVGFQIRPSQLLSDLRFSSTQHFVDTWRTDTELLLKAAIQGLRADNSQIAALWTGDFTGQEKVFSEHQELLPQVFAALIFRIQTINVKLVSAQTSCGLAMAFVVPHSAVKNEVNVCPILKGSN